MPRTRGAQPDNLNALKHGFYSRRFRTLELADLSLLSAGLESEIAALRIFTRRLIDLTETSTPAPDLDTALEVLNGLGLAFIRIASLLRTNLILTGSDASIENTLALALSEIQQELKA